MRDKLEKQNEKRKIINALDWKFDPFKIENEVFSKPLTKSEQTLLKKIKF